MAYEIPGFSFTLVAGEDLRTKQFYFVKLDTNGAAVACAAVTDRPVGILQNKPNTGGEATIMAMGISKVSSDEALAIAALIGTSGDGQAQVVAAGEITVWSVGVVLEASGNAGEIATVLFNCMAPGHTAVGS